MATKRTQKSGQGIFSYLMDKYVLFGVISARQIKRPSPQYRMRNTNTILKHSHSNMILTGRFFIFSLSHLPVDEAITIAYIEPFHSSLHRSSCNSTNVRGGINQ